MGGERMPATTRTEVWLAAGVRTPFAKVDGPLARFDAIELSVPVVRHMIERLGGAEPDFVVWGNVVPNLAWSNIAREVLMDAGVAPTIPAHSTVMACGTNPHGGSVALGHPFGATGARILSQAVKELAGHAPGERAIVSICTDGGQGTVALLEAG
jgi:acetyl-CoA acetyltransferase